MSHRTMALAIALILAAAPVRGQEVVPPSIALPSELDRVLRDYERAWRAGDVPALVALFTSDGLVMQPGRPPARGHAALASIYRGQGGSPLRLRPLAYAAADANLAHLQPWMPWAMDEPSPLEAVTARLEPARLRDRVAFQASVTVRLHGQHGALVGPATGCLLDAIAVQC